MTKTNFYVRTSSIQLTILILMIDWILLLKDLKLRMSLDVHIFNC